jgi:hypothetical protein
MGKLHARIFPETWCSQSLCKLMKGRRSRLPWHANVSSKNNIEEKKK